MPAAAGPERLRRRQILGLLLLAALILIIALLRADWHWIFPRGWWRW
jgi:hypothetical protein